MTPLKARNAEIARARRGSTYCHPAIANRPANACSIVPGEEGHDRVLPLLSALRKSKLARAGAISIEKINAPSRAKATVHAIGLNSRPSTRCRVKMGRYAVMMMAMA